MSFKDGHNNLVVTVAEADTEEDRKKICFCNAAVLFGGSSSGLSEGTRVFLSGNRLTNYDLTLDCDIYFTKGVAKGYVGGENVDLFLEKNDTELLFAAYIHGIDPYYYTDTIVLRPYVQTEYGTEYGEGGSL